MQDVFFSAQGRYFFCKEIIMAVKPTNKDRMRVIVVSIENGRKELFESVKY